MDIKIKLNGEDVSEKIKLSKCLLYDRFGSILDSISIGLPSELKDIEFFRDDEIEITAGSYKSGLMYIDGCSLLNGKRSVEAISSKPSIKERKSAIYRYIRLLQLAGDIANEKGLTLKTYGVTDYTYDVISRVKETDLEFLNRICQREGYSVKCDNGNLIIFSEHDIENNSSVLELKESEIDPNYSFIRATNGLSALTVRYFDFKNKTYIQHTATDKDINGGTKILTEYVKDVNEAQRFATGYLRQANKEYLKANLSMSIRTDISAGTVLNLKNFNEYSGKYVVYNAVHDVMNDKTYLDIRGILTY